MIKAVIFDCFGVLAQDAWFPFLDTYVKNPDHKEQAQSALSRVGAGLMRYEDFYAEVGDLLNIPQQEIRTKLTQNPPDIKLFDFIETKLKQHYKIGMLSNAGTDRTVELFGSDRAALFDDVVLSYQFGMTKPDAALYELAASRLDVLTSECIFIDDQPRYCKGAKDVGMEAIHHMSASMTIDKIEEILNA